MSKYEVGYKAVIEVDKVFEQDGEKLYRAKGMKSLVFDEKGLDKLKSLSAYTETLKKEAEENYRMGANAEYEKWKEHLSRIRAEGHSEAWELAKKINDMDIYDTEEIFIEAGAFHLGNVLENYTYSEAAAKVSRWEKAKEEIKVGDVVRLQEGSDNDLCILCKTSDGKYYNAVDKYGALYPLLEKEHFSKTGCHIDIDGFLKQIGSE